MSARHNESRRAAAKRDEEILLITPHADVRDLVTPLFERAGYRTHAVESGGEGIAAAAGTRPVLVLLDLDLIDMTGYEACYELRDALGDGPPIIVVSGELKDPADRVAGITIGADDFLTKPFDPDELLARVRRSLARTTRLPAALDTPLTAREIEVLQLLADGSSQDAIAEELFISVKTVATHIQRIITKLGVHSRTEAVALAYRTGLVTGAAAPD
jgi:two-component system nitrate/nitrite response regulator NarL